MIDLSFIKSKPHLIIGSSIMSFVMMYADQLEVFVTLLIALSALLAVGIPVTEFFQASLIYFMKKT